MNLLEVTENGLYCAAADAYIDPLRNVSRALLTHAHADHARAGSGEYWAADAGVALLHRRLGRDQTVHGVAYHQTVRIGDARVSFHPAGHVLGSAQIRVEYGGEVWVVTGDFKREPDPTCAAFTPVHCDVLITEATFALPIYRWPATAEVVAELFDWWQQNRREGRASVLFAYALGKAQRVLAELTAHCDDTVLVHGAVQPLTDIYRDAGVSMLPTETIDLRKKRRPGEFAGRLIVAPPGAQNSAWMRRFAPYSTGFCSGWMQIRGRRQWRGVDRGFVLSDHADWAGLLQTVEDSRARRVLVTHGKHGPLVRYLNERGVRAEALAGLRRDDEEQRQNEAYGDDDNQTVAADAAV